MLNRNILLFYWPYLRSVFLKKISISTWLEVTLSKDQHHNWVSLLRGRNIDALSYQHSPRKKKVGSLILSAVQGIHYLGNASGSVMNPRDFDKWSPLVLKRNHLGCVECKEGGLCRYMWFYESFKWKSNGFWVTWINANGQRTNVSERGCTHEVMVNRWWLCY